MSLQEINQRIVAAKKFSKPWHNNITRWRKLYAGKHYPDAKKRKKTNEPSYVDPTFTNTIDLAVGILHTEDVVWKATSWNVSVEGLKDSDVVEKAISGFIDVNADREMMDLYHEANLNFVRDGGACIYSIWDSEIHDNCEIRKTILDDEGNPVEADILYELPLTIKMKDPLKVHVLPGGPRRWQAVMYIEDNIPVYTVEKRYGINIAEFSDRTDAEKQTTLTGELIDYWDYDYVWEVPDDYEAAPEIDEEGNLLEATEPPKVKKLVVRHALLFNNEFIQELDVMDGYKSLAYKVNFYNPADPNDSEMWQSILSPLEEPVRDLEIAVNRRQRLINMFASLPVVVRTRGGRTITLDNSLGETINLDAEAGEDIGFPQWNGSPPDVDKQIELYRSRIQQSGFSDVMYGQGPSGVSGYALSQLGDQNRIRLETAISHLEDLWKWAARDWIHLTTEFASDKYLELYGFIRGQDFAELIPGDSLDGFNVRCKIKAEFPNEKVRKHAMATQVKDILSLNRIMEDYLDVQQPADERKKKLIEVAEQHPALQNYAVMANLQDMADAGDKIAAMVIAQEQQKTMGGKGGRPPEPNAPEQGLGVQNSDQMNRDVFQGNEAQITDEITNMGRMAPQMVDGGIQ